MGKNYLVFAVSTNGSTIESQVVESTHVESHTVNSETVVSVELLQAARATIISAKITFFILLIILIKYLLIVKK
jgi:hypothetical protein